MVTKAKRMNSTEFVESASKGIDVSKPDVSNVIGDAKLLRQSPILRQFEDVMTHVHEGRSDFGRDGKITGSIIDSGRDPKCYYNRAKAWVDADTGEPVGAWVLHAKVFRLEESEILKAYFHEMAHCRCGLAYLLGNDKSPDTTVTGKHSSKLFKLTALDYFTEASFITKEEFEKDTKTLAKKQNRTKYAKSDMNTIRATGWEFQPWLVARLATFNNGNGLDMSVFNVYRVMDVGTTRNPNPTVAVGCLEHHWDVDAGDRELYNARIREDAKTPACTHADHYEAIIRAAISAHNGDIGPNNVTGQLDSFIDGIEDRLPIYVIEPKAKD
jgi:hypothetical protein